MADLIDVLPNYDLSPWRHLTYSLEKKGISTAELISLDPVEIARKCPLPLKEVRRMAAAVTDALKADLGRQSMPPPARPQGQSDAGERPAKRSKLGPVESPSKELQYVKTLDPRIDECLGGGFPAGSVCEIVGESAVGKTQFVLSLLLAAQLPPPHGLGRRTLYLSTESSLNTVRLNQILRAHSQYLNLPLEERPSTDNIMTVNAHNLEKQEHVTTYQLPEAVRRYDVGLIVIDSVAANFRVEFQGASPKVLGERAVALVKLGRSLRKIAHEYNVAIVCTNQVADRFDADQTRPDKFRWMSSQSQPSSQATQTQADGRATPNQQHANSAVRMQPPTQLLKQASPATRGQTRQPPRQPSAAQQARKDEIMSLDFQQRFFTGWGDSPSWSPFEHMKTPALGLTWANQLDARIVLKISSTIDRATAAKNQSEHDSYLWSSVKRRRHLKVVFAPWAAPSVDEGVEYELEMQGPVSIEPVGKKRSVENEDFDADDDDLGGDEESAELLDPKYWEDIEDEEFP